jgi:uncharacterized protein YndB with AHSA1/START domain
MMSALSRASISTLPELSLRRIFSAPRELLFEVFTNPEHIIHWIGPRAFTATRFEQDTRPGGKWSGSLHQTSEWNGQDYPDLGFGGVFKEVRPPERLVYTFAWEGQGGQPTSETLITVTFTELSDYKTQMDFHQESFDSVEHRDGHSKGWNSSFDRLNNYLKALTN